MLCNQQILTMNLFTLIDNFVEKISFSKAVDFEVDGPGCTKYLISLVPVQSFYFWHICWYSTSNIVFAQCSLFNLDGQYSLRAVNFWRCYSNFSNTFSLSPISFTLHECVEIINILIFVGHFSCSCTFYVASEKLQLSEWFIWSIHPDSDLILVLSIPYYFHYRFIYSSRHYLRNSVLPGYSGWFRIYHGTKILLLLTLDLLSGVLLPEGCSLQNVSVGVSIETVILFWVYLA